MAELKKSDVTGTVGKPDEFLRIRVRANGHTWAKADVHESDSREKVKEHLMSQSIDELDGFFKD